MPPPSILAGLIFGLCGLFAAGTIEFLLRTFAEDAGINRWIFAAVPGLFAMLYAILVYQDAKKRVRRITESISRGILIALLSWLSVSALITWAWCADGQAMRCFSETLLVSGVVGGGPMLVAAIFAGWISGLLITQADRESPARRIRIDDGADVPATPAIQAEPRRPTPPR